MTKGIEWDNRHRQVTELPTIIEQTIDILRCRHTISLPSFDVLLVAQGPRWNDGEGAIPKVTRVLPKKVWR